MKRFALITLIFILKSSFIFSQISITGKVQNKKQTLEFVSVTLFLKDSLVSGSISNEKGIFKLEVKQAGEYNLNLSFIGYKSYSQKIKLEKNQAKLNLQTTNLEKDNKILDDVKIDGNAVVQDFTKNSLTISKEMLKGVQSSTDLLNKMPFINLKKGDKTIFVENEPAIILINGRRIIGKNQVSQILAPERIKKIEVITHPSVQYSGDNVSKIVNIILKNDNFGYDSYLFSELPLHNFYTDNRLNFSAWFGKFRLWTNISYYNSKDNPEYNKKIKSQNQDFLYQHTEESENTDEANWDFSSSLGLDYFINKQHSISLIGNYSTENNTIKNSFSIKSETDNILQEHYKRNYFSNYPYFNQGNLSFFHKYSFNNHKQVLTTNINAFYFEAKQNSAYKYEVFKGENQIDNFFSSIENRKSIKGDINYSQTINKNISISTGVNSYFQNLNTQSISNSENTVNLDYKENRNSAYFSWQHKVNKKFFYRIGLNLELSKVGVNDSISNTNTSLFPAIIAAYRLSENQKIALYTRRNISRPSRYQLNPTVVYIDAKNIRTGNIKLKPSFKDVYFAKYSFSKNKFYANFYLGYVHEKDIISQTKYLNENNIMTSSFQNILSNNSYSARLKLNFKLFKFWKINQSFNAGYVEFEKTKKVNFPLNKGWRFGANHSSTIEFLKDYEFYYNLNYNDYSINAQNKFKMGLFSYIELSRNIFKDKGTIAIGYSWKHQPNENIFEDYNFYQEDITRINSTLTFTFTYSFSSKKTGKKVKAKFNTENESVKTN